MRPLRQFWRDYPDAEGPLRAWYFEAKRAAWRSSAELKARYPHASIVNATRVVFNIGGNKYRLVARIRYQGGKTRGRIHVRFIGTHEQYDRIDAAEV